MKIENLQNQLKVTRDNSTITFYDKQNEDGTFALAANVLSGDLILTQNGDNIEQFDYSAVTLPTSTDIGDLVDIVNEYIRRVPSRLTKTPSGYICGASISYRTAGAVRIGTSGIDSILRDSTDTYDVEFTGMITVGLTGSGANGLDTGSESNNTWYSVWVIADSSETETVAGIFSESETAPILPVGYDKFRRVGWVRNDASSDIIQFQGNGNDRTRTTTYLTLNLNRQVLSAGSATIPTSIDCSSFVPPGTDSIGISVLGLGTTCNILKTTGGGVLQTCLGSGSQFQTMFPCTATQTIAYDHTAGGGVTTITLESYIDNL